MARVLAIDYGKRRMGIAVTDPLQLIATPLKAVEADQVVPFLKSYLEEESVSHIVIGLPYHLDGALSPTTMLVKKFTRFLCRHFPTIPISHYDERFTSSMAKDALLKSGIKKSRRREKSLLDMISATLILQSFLASSKEKCT